MSDKIIVGPFNKGLKTNVAPFAIDNDSFPTLINAYQWRGRIKRKRGTAFLGRLHRYIGTTDAGGNLVVTILPIPITEGIVSFIVGANVFTDPGGALPVPTILLTNGPGTATLNRTTGVLTITGSIPLTSVFYFPTLPVMGLEDLILQPTNYPKTLAFDTKYSYIIKNTYPYDIYDVSFYKNPPTGTYTGYVQKTTPTSTWWNGQDYQQFWTTNYEDALWATNGVTVPFNVTNIGMQFKYIISTTAPVGTAPVPPSLLGGPSTINLEITAHGLVVGDFVFINEIPIAVVSGINFQTGYVIAVVDANNITVEFPNAYLTGPGGPTATGIAQYLTNRSDTTKDCIRWYDGDPTNGDSITPLLNGRKGWVNFMPPLSALPFSISDKIPQQYYLVGAKIIVPFKDRLLFFGPVIQSASKNPDLNVPLFLEDTVIYSQNGTPYYTASFTGDPSLATTEFFPILVPTNQIATATAWWEDQTGFGGFIRAGTQEVINTVSSNKDILIVGLTNIQTKLIYTSNDIIPFNFYLINSELGSESTFSFINMDKGTLTRGARGYTITSQNQTERIDVEIPDEVFEIRSLDNGAERFTAQRDFINEWVYFTYPSNQEPFKFPNRTLFYNYRDDTWAIFNECYTHYGQFRKAAGGTQDGLTWATVGTTYPTWADWNVPWNGGISTLLTPDVIAGNQQGFVVFRDEGTDESNSLYIQNIAGNTITSPNHTLSDGDYIIISGTLGAISTQVNGKIFKIYDTTTNTFKVDSALTAASYLGGGLIKRMYIPIVQTKQFPVSWGMGRKTRIGVQQYLLTTTAQAQITLLIFLSQNDSNPYNDDFITNDSLIYSTVLQTCPESTNLGLTPPNINLNQVTAINQNQIWHRINTSLLGDTIQLGFTLSDSQMRSFTTTQTPFTITGITKGTYTILTFNNSLDPNQQLLISGIVGMTELNNKTFNIESANQLTVTIDVDSRNFADYVSGGIASLVLPLNQFAEIELFGFILDVSPSQMLS